MIIENLGIHGIVSGPNFDNTDTDDIFTYLESLGINCKELRKALQLGIINESQLRENLRRLLDSHLAQRAYKEFSAE